MKKIALTFVIAASAISSAAADPTFHVNRKPSSAMLSCTLNTSHTQNQNKEIDSFKLKLSGDKATLTNVKLTQAYLDQLQNEIKGATNSQNQDWIQKIQAFINAGKEGFRMTGKLKPYQKNTKNSLNQDRYALDLSGNSFNVDMAVEELGNEGTGLLLFIPKDNSEPVRIEYDGDQGPGWDWFDCN